VPYQTQTRGIFDAMDGSWLTRSFESATPHSKVPALVDGDDTVFEGCAIHAVSKRINTAKKI